MSSPFREYRPPKPYWADRHTEPCPSVIPEHTSANDAHTRAPQPNTQRPPARAQHTATPERLQARIRSRLADGSAMSAEELARVMGCDISSVEAALRGLIDTGIVARATTSARRYKRTDGTAKTAVFRAYVRAPGSHQGRILGLLKSQPQRWWSARHIAAVLDIPANSAYTTLHALAEHDAIAIDPTNKLYRHKGD